MIRNRLDWITTTYIMCVHFIQNRLDLQFSIDFEQQILKNFSTRRLLNKDIFSYFICVQLWLSWVLN